MDVVLSASALALDWSAERFVGRPNDRYGV